MTVPRPDSPYVAAWATLWNSGFHPIPLPSMKKDPPPSGHTGVYGLNASYQQCAAWGNELRDSYGDYPNIAIRFNRGDIFTGEPGCIGLDVDDYLKDGNLKRGGTTLAEWEAEWGQLPPTWRSTARGVQNISGTRLFLVPPGTTIKAPSDCGIDALHFAHRYLVVAPSINPLTGTRYQWISPDGSVSDMPPNLGELPWLPDKWLMKLSATTALVPPKTAKEVEEFFATLGDSEPCETIKRTLQEYITKLHAPGATRHDVALKAVARLLYLGAEGHPGAYGAIEEFRPIFVAAVEESRGDDNTGSSIAEAEFNRMLQLSNGSSRIVSQILADPPERTGCRIPSGIIENDFFNDGRWCVPLTITPQPQPALPITEPVTAPLPITESVSTPQAQYQPPPQSQWGMPVNDPRSAPPTRVSQEHYRAPLDQLPPVMCRFVYSAAQHAQTAPELPLMGCLASISFVTGNRAIVRFGNGHEQPLCIWAASSALPSERKSGAMDAAVRSPMREAIAEFWNCHSADQASLAYQIRAQHARLKKLEQIMAEPGGSTQENIAVLDVEIQELRRLKKKVMHEPVWGISDATPEGLETEMAESGGVAASFTDEAALLSTIAGRYSSGKINLYSMNQAWSGNPIHVKRAGKDNDRRVDEPYLVLCQFTQPAQFAQLMSTLRDQEDGFLSRWLFSEPASYGYRQPTSPPIDLEAREAWVKTLRRLLERFWGEKQPICLTLSHHAQVLYNEIYAEIEAERAWYQTRDGVLAQWLGKAPNAHITRVAALLELANNPDSWEISWDAMQAAINLYRWWLRPEAIKAIAGTSGDLLRPEIESDMLAWIYKQRQTDRSRKQTAIEFLSARVVRRGLRRFRKMSDEEIEAILMHLEAQGWVTRTDGAGSKDSRSQRWLIRPGFDAMWEAQA